MSVSSCICCMFVSCVHNAEVLNAGFCINFSLLMLVEEDAYSTVGLMTALYEAISVFFCLPHPGACTVIV